VDVRPLGHRRDLVRVEIILVRIGLRQILLTPRACTRAEREREPQYSCESRQLHDRLLSPADAKHESPA
jgi:hypothetical protein